LAKGHRIPAGRVKFFEIWAKGYQNPRVGSKFGEGAVKRVWKGRDGLKRALKFPERWRGAKFGENFF